MPPTLGDMLHYPGMESPDLEVFERALKRFGESNLDFVDCLLSERSKKTGSPVMSFDARIA